MSSTQQEQTCWWHPNRTTALRCVRCERYACHECLNEAAVGFQCDDCVRDARRDDKKQHEAYRRAGFGERTVAGAIARERVVVTPLLIVLNVLAYVATAVDAHDPMNNARSGLGDAWFLSTTDVAANGEWWRLLTSGFLHFGPIHLGINMIALWVLGRDLERLLGWWRFAALYVLSLVGGSVSVYLFDSVDRATAGASGAVYGIMGGVLIAVLRLRLNPAPVIGTIALNLVISLSVPQISLLGHLGGLVVGALVTAALVYAPRPRQAFLQVSVMIAVLAVLAALAVLRTGPAIDDICHDPLHQSSQDRTWCQVHDVS